MGETIAYVDYDRRRKQINTADLNSHWTLCGSNKVPLPGHPSAVALAQGPSEVWLLRILYREYNVTTARATERYDVVRITPAAAAEYLIASGITLPDVLAKYNAPADVRQGNPIAVPTEAPGENKSRKGKPYRTGRPTDTDPKQDRRIADAWATRNYRTHQELADAMGLDKHAVKTALDRERKRRKRSSH